MKFKDFEMDKRSDSINKIEDQLFLGSFEGASDSALLEKLDIKTVVTIMDDNIPNDRKAEGVTYLTLIADDRTRPVQSFSSNKFMDYLRKEQRSRSISPLSGRDVPFGYSHDSLSYEQIQHVFQRRKTIGSKQKTDCFTE